MTRRAPRPLRLLLIAPDERDRLAVRRCLEQSAAGHALDEIATPGELRHAERFDCLLCDYRFAAGTAPQLLADLLATPCGDRPPVVLLCDRHDEALVAQAMRDGVQDYAVKNGLNGVRLLASVESALHKAAAEQALRDAAFEEPVTGLPGRRLFLDRLGQHLRTTSRTSQAFAVMCLELAPVAGQDDELLCAVAQRLRHCARRSDTVAALGAGRFAALLPSADSAEGALVAGQKLCAAAVEPLALGTELLWPTLHGGAALHPAHGTTPQDLLARAGDALAQARARGEEFGVFECGAHAGAGPRPSLAANGLDEALLGQQLEIEYQPQVNLADATLSGVEALLRWRHPQYGLLAPLDFVPAAERTAAIKPLTLHVIERVAAQVRTWRDDGLDVPVAINLSSRLLGEHDLALHVAERVRREGLAPGSLTLEITERGMMRWPPEAACILDALRGAGLRVSIDEFGAGCSSLRHLHDAPIDEFKIDAHFVTRQQQPRARAVVRAIVELARGFPARVVAAGIESEQDWCQALALGCGHGQGFFISPPLAADAFDDWRLEWMSGATVGEGLARREA